MNEMAKILKEGEKDPNVKHIKIEFQAKSGDWENNL